MQKNRKHRAELRALHLIDIENLCCTGALTQAAADWTVARYRTTIRVAEGDLVVIGCSHRAVFTAADAWPAARYVFGSGPDGADHALLAVLETERVAERFSAVCLGSGDGIFAPAVAALGAAGCHTTVISWRQSLSARLALTARQVTFLDLELHLPAAATLLRAA